MPETNTGQSNLSILNVVILVEVKKREKVSSLDSSHPQDPSNPQFVMNAEMVPSGSRNFMRIGPPRAIVNLFKQGAIKVEGNNEIRVDPRIVSALDSLKKELR
jgi:hypothetical protein